MTVVINLQHFLLQITVLLCANKNCILTKICQIQINLFGYYAEH